MQITLYKEASIHLRKFLFCTKRYIVLTISDVQIQSRLRFGMANSINDDLRLYPSHHTQHEFLTLDKKYNLNAILSYYHSKKIFIL